MPTQSIEISLKRGEPKQKFDIVMPDGIIQAIALFTEQYVYEAFILGHVEKTKWKLKQESKMPKRIVLKSSELTEAQINGLRKLGLLTKGVAPSVVSNKSRIDDPLVHTPGSTLGDY
jgi:hypothetical protein